MLLEFNVGLHLASYKQNFTTPMTEQVTLHLGKAFFKQVFSLKKTLFSVYVEFHL